MKKKGEPDNKNYTEDINMVIVKLKPPTGLDNDKPKQNAHIYLLVRKAGSVLLKKYLSTW